MSRKKHFIFDLARRIGGKKKMGRGDWEKVNMFFTDLISSIHLGQQSVIFWQYGVGLVMLAMTNIICTNRLLVSHL